MILRDALKEIYYYKIKKYSPSDYRIYHLRRTGMQIGDGCCIFSDRIETNEPYLVSIGNQVMIAPNVMFTTHDASASYYIPGSSDIFGRINIGNHCFLGMGSIFLPGVDIADNCIVGAGSVVTKSFFESGIVIAGNPAKKICTLSELKEKNQKYALNTWEQNNKREYLLANENKFKGYVTQG